MQTLACVLLPVWILGQGNSKIRHSNKNCVNTSDKEEEERENVRNISFNNVSNIFPNNDSMSKVSKMLDILTANYDAKLRPELAGKATKVTVNISIRILGPIDDSKEVLMFTCYLRYCGSFY